MSPRKGRRGRHTGSQQNKAEHGNRHGQQPQQHRQQTQRSAADGSDEGRVINAEKPQISKPGQTIVSVVTPRRQIFRKQMHQRNNSPAQKTYGVLFLDSLAAAKADLAKLRETAAQYDQLNIVIKAEGPIDDPEVAEIGKIFAGAAWTLIHERRRQDGWYDAKNE